MIADVAVALREPWLVHIDEICAYVFSLIVLRLWILDLPRGNLLDRALNRSLGWWLDETRIFSRRFGPCALDSMHELAQLRASFRVLLAIISCHLLFELFFLVFCQIGRSSVLSWSFHVFDFRAPPFFGETKNVHFFLQYISAQ